MTSNRPAMLKFQVQIISPRSGVVGHVVRAIDVTDACERVLRAYPKAELLDAKLLGAI